MSERMARDAAAVVLRDKSQGAVLPTNLDALLQDERVEVEFFDSPREFDGRIELVDGVPAIFVNLRGGGRDDGRTRFTHAHEIAHFYLHLGLLRRGAFFDDRNITLQGDQQSETERDANHFASELLLPGSVIDRELRGRILSLTMIRDLADRARASLQATAIRLVGTTADRCCAVLVKDGVVRWCAASDDWRQQGLPVQKLVDRALPAGAVSTRRADDFEDEKVLLSQWAPQLGFRDVELYESSLMTPFGRLLFLGADDFDM